MSDKLRDKLRDTLHDEFVAGSIAPSDAGALDPARELRTEDFYMDGPYLVFTAAYHLRRGYCCNSECRHCPYK